MELMELFEVKDMLSSNFQMTVKGHKLLEAEVRLALNSLVATPTHGIR